MRIDHRLTLTAVGLLAVSLLSVSATAGAAPFGDRVAGVWLAMLTVPPHPLLGNADDMVMPEYITINADGTGLAQMSVPAVPIPMGGSVAMAAMTPGLGSWEKVAPKRLRFTTLRFLSDMETGDALGVLKAHVELEQASPDLLQGHYFVEIVDLDGNPVRFQGEPITLSGPVVQSRIPVERMPAQ